MWNVTNTQEYFIISVKHNWKALNSAKEQGFYGSVNWNWYKKMRIQIDAAASDRNPSRMLGNPLSDLFELLFLR